MPRLVCICLLAAGLLLGLAPAQAADLVLKNTCTAPVTVCVLSPCGQGSMKMVQVAKDSAIHWQRPSCAQAAKAPPQQMRLGRVRPAHRRPGLHRHAHRGQDLCAPPGRGDHQPPVLRGVRHPLPAQVAAPQGPVAPPLPAASLAISLPRQTSRAQPGGGRQGGPRLGPPKLLNGSYCRWSG